MPDTRQAICLASNTKRYQAGLPDVLVGADGAPGCPKLQMASYLVLLLLYSYIHGAGAACKGPQKCGCEADSFCNFDDGNTGFCEPCANFDTIAACYEDGLPKKGEEDCASCCPPHRPTSAPTMTAAPTPAPSTSAPSVSPAPTVTQAPTRFSGPTPWYVYAVLLTVFIAPASVVASAIFLICCRNLEGRCRLCAAAATVPHIVVMAAWTCWIATFLCSHCSMSIIPMLWLMSAGATFVAIVVTGWLVCKQPGEELPFSVAGYKFGATITSDTRRSTAAGEPPAEVIVAGEYVAP